MLEIRNLSKAFGRKKGSTYVKAIDDTTLTLPDAGLVAIFGKSGCGKTTLLNVIGGLESADFGSVLLDGKNVLKNPDAVRNEKIGYIFQNYNLLREMTVQENVAMGLSLGGTHGAEITERRVMGALTCVGMQMYAKRTPDTLSGGQQQRVAIARAIVKDPAVILADEPTGNLDEANTIEVMNILKEISRRHLVLLVTHEAELVDQYCDQVIEIADGKVVSVVGQSDSVGGKAVHRNKIFLGDLERSEIEDGNLVLESYTDGNAMPRVSVRLIYQGGKVYLQTEGAVTVLDDKSELCVYEQKREDYIRSNESKVDLSVLSEERPINGKMGRAFGFKNSVVSGFLANFGKKSGAKSIFSRVMMLSAMIVVLLAASFGYSIQPMFTAFSAVSDRTVFVFLEDETADGRLHALTERYGATVVRYGHITSKGTDTNEELMLASLLDEGFVNYEGANVVEVKARLNVGELKNDYAYVDASLIRVSSGQDMPLLWGSRTVSDWTEVVITRAFAQKVIDELPIDTYDEYPMAALLDYEVKIKRAIYDYGDLNRFVTNAASVKVVGIVDSDDCAILMDDGLMDIFDVNYFYATDIAPVGFLGSSLTLGEGEVARNKSRVDLAPESDLIADEALIGGRYYSVTDSFSDQSGFAFGFAVSDETFGQLKAAMYDYGYYLSSAKNFANYSVPIATVYAGSDATDGLIDSLKAEFSEDCVYGSEWIRHNIYVKSVEDWRGDLAFTVAVCIAIGVCFCFIMRSALLKRVKEVGIYRAIGVTSGNLVFRFLIENAVVIVCTVVAGYLIASAAVLFVSATVSYGVTLWYPWWIALSALLILVLSCTLAGIIPILSIVGDTPAEILAKYEL